MTDRENRIVRFDELNWLGKIVYVTGATVRVTSTLIDTAIDKAADVWVEAEEAFKKELDPNMEDAKVLEEINERKRS